MHISPFQKGSEIAGLGIWRPGFCTWFYHQLPEGLKQSWKVFYTITLNSA